MTKTVMFNPYTGTPRHPSDIASDPSGLLILEPGAPLRAAAQVVALEPEGPDGHGVNWLAGKRPTPGDLLYGGDAVARALAAKNEAESRELKSLQELDEQREQLACVRQALPEEWRNSVPSVAVSTLAAEIATLREQLARFTPLRAKGVVDADDNLDCWDTNPYEICTRHVAALNEKDPAAMWRVVDLFARDEAGPGA